MTFSGDMRLERRRPEVFCTRRGAPFCILAVTLFMSSTLQSISCTLTENLADGKSCASVKLAYGSKGFNDHDVPQQMLPGGDLQICPQSFTCCTREMEENLSLQSSRDFQELVKDKLNVYRQIFATRLVNFDGYFVELINQSRADLNDMFLRTYGLLYQQNVELFVSLFQDLQSYYRRTDVNIADVFDGFFSSLMQRIFRLLNDQHLFSDDFFDCIDEHLNQLKPFGDIPLKLYLQVKRSFTAARVFVEGLATGRDVIQVLSKMEQSHMCSREWMQLTYCSYCGGSANVEPCASYCLNVLTDCSRYSADVNRVWNVYLGEMQTLAARLDGPFNIEMVVSPLGVKISEAIMVFQENSDSFSSKVFQGCGERTLQNRTTEIHNETRHNETRLRREASTRNSVDFEFDSTHSPTSTLESSNHSSPRVAKHSLSRLIRDVQSRLEAMRDLWKKFPEIVCNYSAESDAELGNETHTCWNGSGTSRDVETTEGPENVPMHQTVIETELFQLRTMIGRLRNAHSGLDSDYGDESSGSGSEDYEVTSGSGMEEDLDLLHTTTDIYISASQKAATDPKSPVDSQSTRRPDIFSFGIKHCTANVSAILAGLIVLLTIASSLSC